MKPLVLAALIALPAGPFASAQMIEMGDADAETRALIEVALADALRESRASGAPEHLSGGRADLNGDGRPEVLGQVYSGFLCGAGVGCPIAVFEARADGGYAHVDTLGADAVTILPTSSNGWRDLSLDLQIGSFTVRWTGSGYAR